MSIKQTASNIIKQVKAGRLKEMAGQLKWVLQYAKKHWLATLFYTLIGLVGTGLALLTSFITRDITNMIINHEAAQIIQYFAMMIGFQVAQTGVNQVTDYISAKIGMTVDAEIKSEIFSKILVTDWESLTNYHTGDLLTRWSSDASTISGAVLGFIPNLIVAVAQFVSAFVVVIIHDPTFAIFAFLGIPVSLALSKTLMKRMVNINQQSAQMGAKLNGFNQEAFSNIQTIKAFSLIPLYVKYLRQLQKEYITMKLNFQKMSIWTSVLLSTVGMLVSYATWGWGIYRLWSGALDYGTMTMFLGLTGSLTGALKNLTGYVPSTIGLCTSAGRLMDIVEMPREDYSDNDKVLEFAKNNEKNGISLAIREIEYGYKNGGNVFEGASIEAKPHEVVALVGPSGEGKTTMLRLILSLMNTTDGLAYCYGGSDTNTTDEDKRIKLSPATRQLFAYVPQGNTMFSGTIAHNMRNVKEDATDEEIIDALKKACAWDFVEKLPGQLEYELAERGGGLSEGQAQRLSIARALLRKSPLLLLDEATSALDNATEKRVLDNIMRDEYPRTCIVTTHRPSVLSSCTRVYEIKDKKCVQLGDEEIVELMTPPKRKTVLNHEA